MHAFESKLSKELKNDIKIILVGPAVFKLWIKTLKVMFDQYLKNCMLFFRCSSNQKVINRYVLYVKHTLIT